MKRKWFAEHNECAEDVPAADKGGRIGLSQVWSVFLILAAGAAAGVIVAVLEVLYYNKLFKGEQGGELVSRLAGISQGPM